MIDNLELAAMSALELRNQLASGLLSSTDLARSYVARIEAREEEVQAWAWFDAERVLVRAAQLDAHREAGKELGPLHGLPVGVKDVIDTAGILTENGCPVDSGRVPDTDAELVTRLEAAGAIMFGKTVTTELAFMHPNKTRNPHNPKHTPGGSSSGSAAAVADAMIPLAIGTQTGGSVIRPASFCGIVGFKPSYNAIPRAGVCLQSHSLDTVGVFAKDPIGAGLLAETLSRQPMMPPRTLTRAPKLGFVSLPGWESADPASHSAFKSLCSKLGETVVQEALPELFDDVADMRAILNTVEMGYYYNRYLEDGADLLGPPTREAIEEGRKISAHTYVAALERQQAMPAALAPLFDRYDALLCPAALGPAPFGLGSTGDSIFNGLWTMAGTPSVTLPLFTAPNGLPMGAQLVGPIGADAKLLGVADWLWNWAKN